MKPSPLTYHRPSSVEDACRILSEVSHEGKVLAGGQSLVPLLSMRLAAPAHIVDIGSIPNLASVTSSEDEGVRFQALATHSVLAADEGARRVQPLLNRALQLVAHPPTIRNRGTSVGSIVHADPSAEMPAVLTLLGGQRDRPVGAWHPRDRVDGSLRRPSRVEPGIRRDRGVGVGARRRTRRGNRHRRDRASSR